MRISQNVKHLNAKFSAYYFYVKTKILPDFRICISVPLRHNNNSFMKKNLRKAIMHRSKLKNCFNNCRTHENWCNYKTQRNDCVSLLRKTKQQYFKNLNLNDVTEINFFGKP